MLAFIENETLKVSADSLGAELHSIKSADGIDNLWKGDPVYWKGRSPILFPIAGALRGGRAVSREGEVTLPRHGLARSYEWIIENAKKDSMTFLLKSDDRTRRSYPYDFALRVCYTLDGNSLKTAFSIRNTGKTEMPYCIGGHPAFNVPLVDGEDFTDYKVKFEKPETADCPFVDMDSGIILDDRRRVLENRDEFTLRHDLFVCDALVFDNLKSRSVKLYSEKSGRGVQMDFDGMNYFAVWSPVKSSPFVCLEPWTGTATLESEDDVFENKRGMRLLKPGEEAAVSFTVRFF